MGWIVLQREKGRRDEKIEEKNLVKGGSQQRRKESKKAQEE